jgi:hypothetical protein
MNTGGRIRRLHTSSTHPHTLLLQDITKGAPMGEAGGGTTGLQPPPQTPQNQNLKNTDFVDTMTL